MVGGVYEALTKEPGKGTGLGLYICRNIIDGLKGSLECTSVEGEGTCFTIILPTFMPE
ncbi:MAG: ATP-binding protein [Candidatus Sedimenticola endophacoides]